MMVNRSFDTFQASVEAVHRDPVVAQHGEPDEEGEKLREQVLEPVDELARALFVPQRGHPDRNDQQGHRDGEHRVGEERRPLELQPAPP